MSAENYSLTKEVIEGRKDHVLLKGHTLESLKQIPDASVQMCCTSPPYFGLRNYGTEPMLWGGDKQCEHAWQSTTPRRLRNEKDVVNPNSIQKANKGANCNLPTTLTCTKCQGWLGELGLEPTPDLFVEHLCQILDEVFRVLRDDGTLWLNLGDSYATHAGKSAKSGQFGKDGVVTGFDDIFTRNKPPAHTYGCKEKDLIGVPWMAAMALRKRGWYLRQDVVWDKTSPMPFSGPDRCTTAHEYIFLLSKRPSYYYDKYAVRNPIEYDDTDNREDFANLRSVWKMPSSGGYKDSKGQHHGTFPEELPRRCILLGSSEKGACAECGKPYAREIEKIKSDDKAPILIRTLGWKKVCKCSTDLVRPCVVIDIFSGSGTTGMVALKNGRNYIGCELQEDYYRMSSERLSHGNLPLLELLMSQ